MQVLSQLSYSPTERELYQSGDPKPGVLVDEEAVRANIWARLPREFAGPEVEDVVLRPAVEGSALALRGIGHGGQITAPTVEPGPSGTGLFAFACECASPTG
jgi:hypothetical protein